MVEGNTSYPFETIKAPNSSFKTHASLLFYYTITQELIAARQQCYQPCSQDRKFRQKKRHNIINTEMKTSRQDLTNHLYSALDA